MHNILTFENFQFNYNINDESKSYKIKKLPESKKHLVLNMGFPKYQRFDKNRKQWKTNELLVLYGSFLYDVSKKPEIYFIEANNVG